MPTDNKPLRKTSRFAYRFLTLEQLARWLQDSEEGEAMVRQAVDRRLRERESVLVVLHSDGWVEVYADRQVAVHVATKLHVTTADTATLAEEYLTSQLPRRFRRLYWPRLLRWAEKCGRHTPEAEAEKLRVLEIIKGIKGG